MLQTDLQHVNTEEETRQLIAQNSYVMICCGRMGPMCVPVYNIMHQLESEYPHVVFRDMDFDTRDADFIRMLPECRSFMGLPFTIYYKDGKVAQATSSIQNREQIVRILDQEFAEGQNE
jgi:thioredoxin 1